MPNGLNEKMDMMRIRWSTGNFRSNGTEADSISVVWEPPLLDCVLLLMVLYTDMNLLPDRGHCVGISYLNR